MNKLVAIALTGAVFLGACTPAAPPPPPAPTVIAMLAIWKCHTPVLFETYSDGTLKNYGASTPLTEQERKDFQDKSKALKKEATGTMFIPCTRQEEEAFQEQSGGDIDAQSTHKYHGPVTST